MASKPAWAFSRRQRGPISRLVVAMSAALRSVCPTQLMRMRTEHLYFPFTECGPGTFEGVGYVFAGLVK
jgi:hypothetical protein